MALSIVTFAGNSGNGNAGSFDVPDDAAMQAGDVRYVMASISNGTITTPSGWANISGSPGVVATSRRIYVFRRVHSGAESTTTFTFSAANNHSWVQFAARGADTTTPEDVGLSVDSNTTGTSVTAPSVTTVTDDAVLVSMHAVFITTNGATLSLPSGMTSVATGSGNGSAGHLYRGAYEAEPTAGATGTRTATSSGSGAWGAAAFAIRPGETEVTGTAASSLGALTARATGTLAWKADAEDNSFDNAFADTSAGAGGIDYLSPQVRAIVTSPVRGGTYAYSHTVNGVASNGSQRCESRAKSINFYEGDERWLRFSTYLPSGFPTSPGSWQLIHQLKNDGSGSPPLALHVEGGKFELQGGDGHPGGSAAMTPKDLGAASTGAWDDWLWRVKFSSDNTVGEIQIWRNGVEVLATYKPPGGTLYPNQRSYPKFGLYRDPALSFGSGVTVYHDQIWLRTTAPDNVTGTAASSLGGLTVAMAGTGTTFPNYPGTGTFPSDYTYPGAGQNAVIGLGGLTATAAGTRTVLGSATGTLGALSATAAGTRENLGAIIAAPLGGLTVAVRGGTTVEVGTVTVQRRAVRYELVVVARVMQRSEPPVLLEVDALDWSGLSWSDELSRPQRLDASVRINSLSPEVIERLRDMANLPSELHLYRDGTRVFAGPWVSALAQGETLTIQGLGLLGYLRYRDITTDHVFTQVDQFSIVKSLVDATQGYDYGDVGIITSAIGTSGVLRDATYRLFDRHNIGQRIEEMGARANGFDIEVDPQSRALQLWYPAKGTDRSEGDSAVVFDGRNITDTTVSWSVAPGDVASLAVAIGTSDKDPVYGYALNEELQSRFGLAFHTETFDGVSNQDTIDDHAQAALDVRDQALLIPGPSVRVDADLDLDGWSVGDTVAYQLHDVLRVRGNYRVRKRTVSVDQAGRERVSVEFV